MARRTSADEAIAAPVERAQPSVDSEVTWLLNRAAQHLRAVTAEESERFGLQIREYIVLTALVMTPGLTQVELARSLGLDKTTLMSQLDRLERVGFVRRRNDPNDRRRRFPEITDAGESARRQASAACAVVEAAALDRFSDEQVRLFRQMLIAIIGDGEDRGSCL